MDIGKIMLVLFVIFKIVSWINKSKKENTNKRSAKAPKKTQSLDDILGDFMKQIEQKTDPKPKEILVKDIHKAEEDTGKQIDRQAVQKTNIKEKEQLLNRDDYKNISYRNKNIEIDKIDENDENSSSINILKKIDLRQAVLYKEILDRKYFSV